ncbi:MAG: dienelactone hydrolase family protein [Thermodesulfobacteriota bacterium]
MGVPPVAALVAALVLRATAVGADTILEPVSFPGPEAKAPLAALLSRPDGPGPFPALIFLHGCAGMYGKSGRLSARQIQWDGTMRAAGFVTLHVDSFTPRGIREVCTVKNRSITVWRDRRADAYAALSWLRSLPFVRPDAVAAMGWSQGGLTVLAAMERDGTTPGAGFFAGVALYPACRLSGRETLDPSGPLLLLFGGADDWTPPETCSDAVTNARMRGEAVEVKSYPGAHHGFDSPGSKVRLREGLALAPGGSAHVGENPAARLDALERVPEFLERHLPPPARRSTASDRIPESPPVVRPSQAVEAR